MRRAVLITFSALGLLTPPAAAQQVDVRGELVATSDCEATQRLNSRNPGNVRLEPGESYQVIARNNTPGSHYRIRVPDAPSPEQRWVKMTCGTFTAAAGGGEDAGEGEDGGNTDQAGNEPNQDTDGANAGRELPPDGIEYVLAASWQPGFCATRSGQDKAECESQTEDRHDATNFAIHGLWPDDLDDTAIFPCYCDSGGPASCGGRNRDRPASIDISDDALDDLRVAMPGVQSGLHLHEWSKHGSCYEDDKTGADAGADPDEYFRETMALVADLNNSAVQDLFEENLGEAVTREEIEAAFEQDFGEDAGDRVLVRCARVDGENILTELWIGLKGDIGSDPDLGALIQAAPETETSSNQRSCNSGRVVKVGD